MKNLLAWLAVYAVLAGGAAAQTGAVAVSDAWARATPGGATVGAAYLTIESAAADRLTRLETPVADKAELHSMTTEGGVMRMRPLDGIDLHAGRPVMLKPGAAHIMLVGLKQPLQAGQTFPLTLHFAEAGTREVIVAVGRIGATAPPSHASHGAHSHNPVNR